jgi:hypothetical protein
VSDIVLAVGVGLFCDWAVLQSFVNYFGWLLAPGWIAAVILGGMFCPIGLSLTGLPQRLARPNVEFWGGGALTRAVVAGSLYACLSIAWGIAIVLVFGTRPDGT